MIACLLLPLRIIGRKHIDEKCAFLGTVRIVSSSDNAVISIVKLEIFIKLSGLSMKLPCNKNAPWMDYLIGNIIFAIGFITSNNQFLL